MVYTYGIYIVEDLIMGSLKPVADTDTIWHRRKAAHDKMMRDDPLDLNKSDPRDTPIEAINEIQSNIDPIDTPEEAAAAAKKQKEDQTPAFNPTPTPWGTKQN
jgi:hypothetical protein